MKILSLKHESLYENITKTFIIYKAETTAKIQYLQERGEN